MASRPKKKVVKKITETFSKMSNGDWLNMITQATPDDYHRLEDFCNKHGFSPQLEYYSKIRKGDGEIENRSSQR